jgi:hypothetical protein
MIVDYCIVPRDGSRYVFGKRKARLTTTDTRRSATYVIPGASGGRDPLGALAYPKDVATVTYQWRVTPQRDKTTFDALRDALHKAVGHGRPQQIYLLADDGSYRVVTGKLRGKPYDASKDGRYWADWSVTWELTTPEVSGFADGAGQWGGKNPDGSTVKWGQAGRKWGQLGESFALTLASNSYTLHNPTGTEDTLDWQLILGGRFGPSGAPSGANNISIQNTVTAARVNGLTPTLNFILSLPNTTDRLAIDFKRRSIRLNGAPAWGILSRQPLQVGFLPIVPGDNTFVVAINGAPLSSLAGTAQIIWQPKFGF